MSWNIDLRDLLEEVVTKFKVDEPLKTKIETAIKKFDEALPTPKDFCRGYELSGCCQASMNTDIPFCSDCKEHCGNMCVDCEETDCKNKQIIE